MIAAGVVLAGGRSTRMGTPKACLEWHGSTLLHRTLRADPAVARLDTGLNGEPVAPDPRLPLVAGDTVVVR